MLPYDSQTLALVFAIFVIAGCVKGAVAIGLPTVSLILLSILMPVRDATALMLIPLFASNLLLAWRGGAFWQTAWRYRYFILPQMILIALVAYLSRDLGDGHLRSILGVAVIIFAATGLMGAFPVIAERYKTIASWVFGAAGGVLGGMISVWAPAVVIYLTMINAQKEEFARASGVIITFGAIPLLVAHFMLGHLDLGRAGMSSLALIPSVIGFFIGEFIRHRISEKIFRKMLYVVFFLLGLNMVLG